MRGRGEQVLRKLAWALAAASIVVVGCGGGGGGGGNDNPPPPGGDTGSFVKLAPIPGQVSFHFLTGAARSPGDMTAVVRRVVLSDSFGDVETALTADKFLGLNQYTHQIINLDVPTLSSRFFQTFLLEIKEVRVDNGSAFPDVFPANSTSPLVQNEYPASIRALPGRNTSVAVRLDETMFDVNQPNVEDIFQDFVWRDANLEENPVQGIDTLNGFLSDYVMFDLSGMSPADRPLMSDASEAGKVYFSGDFIALSTSGNSGTFEVLTTTGFLPGTFSPIASPPPPVNGKPKFGVYTLVQDDPRDPSPPSLPPITALQGTYYALSDVVGNMSSFEMITFPRSQERFVFDGSLGENVLRELSVQDVVLITRSGNTITQMYFGQIDFGQSPGDPTTLLAYPIGQVDDADAHNEIEGTVSGFKDINGNPINLGVVDEATRATLIQKICSGSFSLTPGSDPVYGGAIPSGFPTTGRFLVFRR